MESLRYGYPAGAVGYYQPWCVTVFDKTKAFIVSSVCYWNPWYPACIPPPRRPINNFPPTPNGRNPPPPPGGNPPPPPNGQPPTPSGLTCGAASLGKGMRGGGGDQGTVSTRLNSTVDAQSDLKGYPCFLTSTRRRHKYKVIIHQSVSWFLQMRGFTFPNYVVQCLQRPTWCSSESRLKPRTSRGADVQRHPVHR